MKLYFVDHKPYQSENEAKQDHFLCVTGHSRSSGLTHYQPWYQVKCEVERRGFEFTQ